jgi:hypothetical protein
MKNRAKSTAKYSASLSAFVLLFFAASATARAQSRSSSMPSPAVVERNAEQDMMSREWNLTHIPDQVNGQFKTEQVSVFRQVQEDFTNLQLANNKMMQTVFVAKNLDYKLITATTEEIKKRALRLRGNLVLPKLADKEKARDNQPPPGDEQLKASLLTLDRSIMSFVTNPLFKMSDTIDPGLAAKAGHDLESIIQFSDLIRKNVQGLSKTARQDH